MSAIQVKNVPTELHEELRRRAAASPTWACGQPLTPQLLWTSAGFSKPLRLVLVGPMSPASAEAEKPSGRAPDGTAREAERKSRQQRAVAREIKKPSVRVRVASQPTFTRYVFELPDLIGVSANFVCYRFRRYERIREYVGSYRHVLRRARSEILREIRLRRVPVERRSPSAAHDLVDPRPRLARSGAEPARPARPHRG